MRTASAARKKATSPPPGEPGALRDPGPPRGLVRPAVPEPGAFHHVRLPPSPALEDVVQHYWSVRWDLGDAPPQRCESLPHPNVHCVIGDSGDRILGVHTARFGVVLAGRGAAFGIKFRVGGFRALLGAPVSRLRDRQIPPQAVFGEAATRYARALAAEADDGGRVALAEALLADAARPDARARLCARIADTISTDASLVRVDQLCERWEMDARALQRLFDGYAGVGAKWVIARYRLHEALDRIAASACRTIDWPAFALELGYFDQAHFIRDFRRLVGATPAAYSRRCRDAP